MNTLAKALAGGSLALAVGISGAHADVLGSATNRNVFKVTATEQPVPLRTNGAKAVAFETKANNTLVVVTYYAACSPSGEPGDYLSIRIAVDGIDAHPQAGANFALCMAVNATTPIVVGVSRQAFIRVPRAGRHSVQVFASLQLAYTGDLYAGSIVIQD